MLMEESQKMFKAQLTQDFDQNEFKKVSQKFLKDKSTLNFSPHLLNKKLKYVQKKGEQERQERSHSQTNDHLL